jgi:hypothetical protein
MRVRFNKRIYLCTVVTHTEGSSLLLFTTPNGVYTVDLITSEQATNMYDSLLINGYCDVSGYQYSN